MGLAMFCLGGALQYFSQDDDVEFEKSLNYNSTNNSKGEMINVECM